LADCAVFVLERVVVFVAVLVLLVVLALAVLVPLPVALVPPAAWVAFAVFTACLALVTLVLAAEKAGTEMPASVRPANRAFSKCRLSTNPPDH